MTDNKMEDILNTLKHEVLRCREKWGGYRNAHEALGILLEEVDEFKKEVFTNQKRRELDNMRQEVFDIMQVACSIAIELEDTDWIKR